MVGLIHKILFGMIDNVAGETAIAAIRQGANIPIEREFRIDENYDDSEFQKLLATTCESLGLSQDQAETAFATAFYNDSVQRWPTWFRISRNAREFLKRQPAIHNGFATGVSDPEARTAIRDKFTLREEDDRLIVHYKSPNNLCGVYIKLAELILQHYEESATIEQKSCSRRGDEACEIHVVW